MVAPIIAAVGRSIAKGGRSAGRAAGRGIAKGGRVAGRAAGRGIVSLGRGAYKKAKEMSSRSNDTQEKSFRVIDRGKGILSVILIGALLFLAIVTGVAESAVSFVAVIISYLTGSGEEQIMILYVVWIIAAALITFVFAKKKKFLTFVILVIVGSISIFLFLDRFWDPTSSTGENIEEISKQGEENVLGFGDYLDCILSLNSTCFDKPTETEVKQSQRVDYYMKLDMPDSIYSMRDLDKPIRLQYTSVTGSIIKLNKLECYYNSKRESNKFYEKILDNIEFDTGNVEENKPRDLICEHNLSELKEHISNSRYQDIRIIPVLYFTVEKSITQNIPIYDYGAYERVYLHSGHSFSDYSLKNEIRNENFFNVEQPTSNIQIPKVTFSSGFENSLPVIVGGDELDYIRFIMSINFDEKDRNLGKVTSITIYDVNPPSSLELNPEHELINQEFSANQNGVVQKTIELTEKEGVTIEEGEVYVIQKLTINALINVENRQGFIYRLELTDEEIEYLKNFGEQAEYEDDEINVRWSGRLSDNQKRIARENANSVIDNLKNIEFDGTNAYEFAKTQSSTKRISFAMTLSIIAIESHGGKPNADSGESVGLMQLTAPTGRLYGVSPSERKDPKKNIEAGTSHLKYLRSKSYSVNDILAAYNGGEEGEDGALGASVHCPGLKRYECEWDNLEHTNPNTGYRETRDYVLKYMIVSSIVEEKLRNEG